MRLAINREDLRYWREQCRGKRLQEATSEVLLDDDAHQLDKLQLCMTSSCTCRSILKNKAAPQEVHALMENKQAYSHAAI